MNILHINSNYIYSTLHAELIQQLNKLGNVNTIFMSHDGIKKGVIDTSYSNLHIKKTFNKFDRYFFFIKQRKILKKLEHTVDLNKFSLVHAHTLFTDGYVALNLFKKYNIPYVVTVRNTDINLFFKKRVLLRSTGIEILTNASAITFLSESYREQLFNQYLSENHRMKNSNKTYVIPNGINELWHKNQDIEKTKSDEIIRIIYVGRINKNKNILATIKASEILIKKGFRVEFRVIGKNEDDMILKEIMNKDFISYEHNKTREELIEIYREEDIFVMPSFYETFGLVYAEAMSQGLPVIYTENQGFDNQFEDGFVGFRVTSTDYEMIAKKIFAIWENYNYFSQNSLKNANKFDWEKIAVKYNNIYLKLHKDKRDKNEEGN
ncbi:glycosyltransferase family 4 protein [Aerococcus urinaeequi]|uniref:glycosyltransferase family 4 protein n=1 Tax=Aerococcus urinaeequi TaxID=51665 RepID=UPI0022E4749E|nr:glycosyltransferase family 4 protein [Aerococcus urinaeequi]